MKRLGKASGSLLLIKLQTCNLLSKVIDKDIPTQDFFHVYFAEWDINISVLRLCLACDRL